MSADQKACVVFNRLTVTNIENSSGIFIGTNQAIGWSSSSKTNQGFGSLKDANVSRTVTVCRDTDWIDSVFRESKLISLRETDIAAQQCDVDFRSVNVNTVNNGSAIDLGDIKQLGWRSTRKNNYGTGKMFGHNKQSRSISVVFDNDGSDAEFLLNQSVWDQTSRSVKHVTITQEQPSEAEELP